MKFNSTEEIERKYNQKILHAKKRRTEALRDFANWVNKKKKDTSWQENTEKQRQKAMKLVQAYCVQRDTNKNKLWYCISCGRFTTLQGWHYIERSHRGTCCDKRNINGQCVGCNNKTRQSSDDMIRVRRDYTFAMVAKYWAEAIRELNWAKNISTKSQTILRQTVIVQYAAWFPFPTEPRNFRQEWQELRHNGQIPQDILDEVGG